MSDSEAAASQVPPEAEDGEWFVLTQGMEPYERFRYIAQHVLEAAIEEAEAYVADERIFEELELEEPEALEEHLRELDDALQEDEDLSALEREFLCAAVAAVMRENDMQARCYRELFRLAEPVNRSDRGGSG